MRFISKYFLLFIAVLMLAGTLTTTASAQNEEKSHPTVVIVRPIYYDPFFYDPFYHSYRRDRYLYRDPRHQIARELAGNERELEKHLAEYRADGVITAKEQKELDDDYKDVRESREELERYRRYYGDRYYEGYYYR